MEKKHIVYNILSFLLMAKLSLSSVGFAQGSEHYLSFKNQNYQLKELDINTDFCEYAIHYYKNNQVVYSAPSKQVRYKYKTIPYVQLFLGTLTSDGAIINSKPFPLDLNSNLHEAYFAFTQDGKYVYFTTGDQNMGKGLRYGKHLQLYGAEVINNTLENITLLEFNETVASTAYPFLANNDKTLYFSSDRFGGFGGMDLYKVSIIAPNFFGEVKNLGKEINSPSDDMFTFIDQNDVLYFSSNRKGTNGGLDVYGVPLNEERKEVFQLPSPINSSADDFGFVMSNKQGFVASDRISGKGADDIYAFTVNSLCSIFGKVINQANNQPVSQADVIILKNDNIVDTLKVNTKGVFKYNLRAHHNDVYKIKAIKNNFWPDSISIGEFEQLYLSKNIDLKLTERYKKNHLGNEILNIPPVYFTSGNWNINKKAALVLNQVVDFLKVHPKMVVEIDSHTDSRGSLKNNESLSVKRAKSTLDYLVQHGINSNRLISKGFGESVPVNHCIDGVKCTEEEYQLNRRTEFVIVKK
ncbi:OmpA family protein [Wenyingzhuangia sp. IMCC45467]